MGRASLAQDPGASGSTLARWSGDGDREEHWRGRLRDVALHLVVELGGGDSVGVVAASSPGASGAAELVSLWVDPAARGRGCGDALVAGVLAWAAAEHPGTPVVLSVSSGDDGATRLYERHGFVDAGPSPDERRGRQLRRS
ncbi:GNAT family N-acetyltransferase [Pseudokineococcus basanitobsidens]|uniref:GNAT family N-acetyltransferase n=1 Tax=Pseudokineococcus basanitobsidens TaxID=1926649 RepID=A0ABU8RMA7_9ACTN